jgi:hypothetical protein
MMRLLYAVLAACVVGACGLAQTGHVGGSLPTKPVRTIAVMPGGGLLADAVAVELGARGFAIIDPGQTSSLMIRLNLNEVELSNPAGLGKLKGQGIDATLVVKAAGGYDQQPQSATARMVSTENGSMIAGVTWQNGFGGAEGSVADRVMRKGLSQAASDIAGELVSRLRV